MDLGELQARRAEQRRHRRRRTIAIVGVVAAAALAFIVLRGGTNAAPARDSASRHAADGAKQPGGSSSPTAAPASTAATGRPGSRAVPILMYHVIETPRAGVPFPGLYVSKSEFAGQMAALARAGYVAVTQDEMAAYWKRGARLPAGKPIVVSFDNGYHSQFASALPVLQKLHWPAVENIQLTGLPPSQGGLLRQQIRTMVADGWELDTQGFSHADLIKLSPAALRHEVADSRKKIQKLYGVPVNWFCYPSGHFNPTVVNAVKAAGYAGSTTTVPGWNRRGYNPYTLERLRVLGGTSPQALIDQLAKTRGNPPPPSSYTGA